MMRIIWLNLWLYIILEIAACNPRKDPLKVEQKPADSAQNTKNSEEERLNITIENLGEIRKVPDFSKMQNFIENTDFHPTRRPNIYFIFFDTLRQDIGLSEGKNFKKFFDQNFSFINAYAGGTATVYSTYALFHANPSFLTYASIPMQWEPKEYGSIYMKILNKLGYKINIYGYSWDCEPNELEFGSSWEHFLISFFGWNTRLLERCKNNPAQEKQYIHNQDELIIDELEKILPNTIQTSEGNFSFFSFYNIHAPYRWGALNSDELSTVENSGTDKENSNLEELKKKYINAVKAADLNFARVLKLLDTLPGRDEAIIVLISDHGEMLHEHKERSHGGIPYEEKIKIFLSLHFGNNNSLNVKRPKNEFASIMDVFPTLFDYLKTPVPSEFVVGRSLLSNTRDSVLVTNSNGYNPTHTMILENSNYKAWIHIDEENFYNAKSFKLINLTDRNDVSIPLTEQFCFEKLPIECRSIIKNEFSDAVSDIFPNYPNS